jgi:hypothetical protein
MTIPSNALTSIDKPAALARAEAKLTGPSLSYKIATLRRSRSPDPIQQMQTEAIVELYDAVRQIQVTIWPWLLLIPDVGAVRAAAEAAQGGGSSSSSAAAPMANKAALNAARITRRPGG